MKKHVLASALVFCAASAHAQSEAPELSTAANVTPETTLDKQDRSRSCAQFEGRNRVMIEELLEIWGPPDREWGSGFWFLSYVLDDGREVFFKAPTIRMFLDSVCWDLEGNYAPYDEQENAE